MGSVGILHTVFGVAALAFGLIVLLRPKGTRWHRSVGWAYVGSMIGLISSAFLIYNLFGRWGVFHTLAVIALVTLIAGIAPAVLKWPAARWMERHYHLMSYSYLGLLAATGAEIAVRVPGADFKVAAMVASGAVVLAGAVVIHWRAKETLRHVSATRAVA